MSPGVAGPSVGFCEVPDGRSVAYATAGTGAPLVMVPGWLSHVSELWSHPAAASTLGKFSNERRFVWYDRLGCGLSDRSRPSLSIEDDVSQLTAVLAALEIDRCDLIGYSFGGPAAAVFAARHPDRVRHLVLYSTYVRGADLAEQEPYDALVGLVRSGWELAALVLAAIRPFRPGPSAVGRQVTPALTEREVDVLRCVARGRSNKAIAIELGVSVATVERHLTRVYQKLGATGRADAAVRAVTDGLFAWSPSSSG